MRMELRRVTLRQVDEVPSRSLRALLVPMRVICMVNWGVYLYFKPKILFADPYIIRVHTYNLLDPFDFPSRLSLCDMLMSALHRSCILVQQPQHFMA